MPQCFSRQGRRPPATPQGAYARSKADGERFVRALQDCGAPICILYPPGVVGPDDPGLPEGNHGIRALLTQLILETSTGFEALDARDLAAVIAAFLAGPQCGRHVVPGRYLPWPDMIALFDELTGRHVRRLRIAESVYQRRAKAKWYCQTMLATIDAGGRIVVPKEVRERLGLRPGSRIVLTEVEGRLEISPATTPVRLVDQEGTLVAVSEVDLPVLTADQVRDAVEATRR